MSDDDNTVRRIMPQSGLDFNMMLTDTVWGSPQVGQQIKDETGSYELLSFLTRDFRLGNLSPAEIAYGKHYADLAHDCLNDGYAEAFSMSLSRTASTLELSQSKNGFLRRRQNTLTTENLSGEIVPPKKKLLSLGKNGG